MRIKDGFILRSIADEWVVVPTGESALHMQGAMILNEVAAFIWQKLQSSVLYEAVLSALLNDYDIGRDDAKRDLDQFLRRLSEMGALDEEQNECKDA